MGRTLCRRRVCLRNRTQRFPEGTCAAAGRAGVERRRGRGAQRGVPRFAGAGGAWRGWLRRWPGQGAPAGRGERRVDRHPGGRPGGLRTAGSGVRRGGVDLRAPAQSRARQTQPPAGAFAATGRSLPAGGLSAGTARPRHRRPGGRRHAGEPRGAGGGAAGLRGAAGAGNRARGGRGPFPPARPVWSSSSPGRGSSPRGGRRNASNLWNAGCILPARVPLWQDGQGRYQWIVVPLDQGFDACNGFSCWWA